MNAISYKVDIILLRVNKPSISSVVREAQDSSIEVRTLNSKLVSQQNNAQQKLQCATMTHAYTDF